MQEQESGFKSPMNILVCSRRSIHLQFQVYVCYIHLYHICVCYILFGETPKRFKKSVTCQSRNPMVNPSKIFVRQVDVEFNLQLEVDQI